jgi:adenine-specific DNA-methyltransferase
MDYVVGNPPYVRVHNLEDSYDEVKSFVFAQDGMTDLYLVFYELGLRMLNKKGKLCYITPSSWLSSVAGSKMRNYITIRKNLKELIDLEHFQAFKGATTYTMIALFDKTYCDDKIHYYVYSSKMKEKTYVDTLKHKEINIDGKFYLANKDALKVLKEIKTINVPATVKVKNGFATLADKIFITDYPYKKMSIRILKASTGEWHDGFFPYDENGKPVAKEEIFSDSDISQYLNKNKSKLLKAQSEEQNPNWYLYGRAQAINDVYSNKYAIGNIIKNKNTIKLEAVPVGSGVYSGLYILTDLPYDTIAAIINTDEFTNYIAMLKNYKSGGYYTYSSKDLEQYINFKLNK